jgi:multiple sugar transport system permease protein
MKNIKHFLIAPPLLFFIALTLLPLLFTLGLSLTNFSLGGHAKWVGITNYIRLFKDPIFTGGFKNTVLYTLIGVTFQYWLGLILAVMVSSLKKQQLIRLMILLPFMLPSLVIGFTWKTLLDSRFGPVNALLKIFGINAVNWLTNPKLAFLSILIVDTWRWTPFMFLILFAGLRMLPKEPFEAAYVDGASAWRSFWDLTFPMLLPISIAAIVIRSIEAFKIFDIVFFITGGGPGNATSSLTLNGYFTALRSGNMAYGAAMSMLMLLIVAITATVLLVALRGFLTKPKRQGEIALTAYPAESQVSGGTNLG